MITEISKFPLPQNKMTTTRSRDKLMIHISDLLLAFVLRAAIYIYI